MCRAFHEITSTTNCCVMCCVTTTPQNLRSINKNPKSSEWAGAERWAGMWENHGAGTERGERSKLAAQFCS